MKNVPLTRLLWICAHDRIDFHQISRGPIGHHASTVQRDHARTQSQRPRAVRHKNQGHALQAGQALDQALLQHGAPARPVKAQPVLWMKNPRLQKS